MSRKEFMERLEKLLRDISDSEREEALQYYNDYFDDAGAENEAEVLKELVSPEQVAQKIKAGLSDTDSEYSEQGYRDVRFERKDGELSAGASADSSAGGKQPKARKKETNFWKVLAIILLCILVAPVILPVFLGIFLVVIGVALALVVFLAGILVSGLAVLISGIFVIGIGIAQIFAAPAIGIALTGTGCILAALGIVLSAVILWCCIKAVPWLIRGIVRIISYPFRKAGAK